MAEPSALPLPPRAPMLIAGSDARLARRAAGGDRRAFAAIYERYHQELYRYCRAILGESHEAQDALQSTMASALRSLPGEERAIELRPWLYRVAHNESISMLRRRRPVAELEETTTMQTEPGADVAFESRERLRSLVSDLARLPERQRSALVMRELSGLAPEQIGTALDVSTGAARQLVYEARRALQDFAEGRAMECERVRQAISDGDGRVMRGRRMRAHLRGCEGCSDFRAGIEARSSDLELLAPPLSAIAASGVLASVLGGGAAATSGLLGGTLTGGAISAKVLGLIAASAAIGVGAGAVGGVDVPGLGSDSTPRSESSDVAAPAAGAAGQSDTARGSSRAGAGGPGSARAEGRGSEGRGNGKSQRRGEAGGVAAEHAAEGSAAGGASAAAPAGSGQPATPPGSALSDVRSGGRSATPATGPAEQTSPGPPAHANADERSSRGGKPEK